MVKAHLWIGRFVQWRGWAGRIRPHDGNELCGTCNLRMECAFFRRGINVDQCEDYQADETTRICQVCKKLTILESNSRGMSCCQHCGSTLIVGLARWQWADMREKYKELWKKF